MPLQLVYPSVGNPFYVCGFRPVLTDVMFSCEVLKPHDENLLLPLGALQIITYRWFVNVSAAVLAEIATNV
jgi:hypothetical protein